MNRRDPRPRTVIENGTRVEDTAAVFISNEQYNGWKSFSISKRMDSFSGSFQLDIHDRFREDGKNWPIRPGEPVTIFIGKDKILDGYIDGVSGNASAGDRSIAAEGRDKTSDLVDCVPSQQGELKKVNLLQLCEIVCAPFGINVETSLTDIGATFDSWKIKPEETCYETLERAAKQRGVLLISNSDGNLNIVRNSQDRSATELKEGFNILNGNFKYDNKDRFSEIKVIGQRNGTDEFQGVNVASPSAKAVDSGVERFRPTTIVNEANTDKGKAQDRANWEITNRAANSFALTVDVVGFFQQNGEMWRPNNLVKTTFGFGGVVGQDMLIRSCTYQKASDGGTITTIELTRPDAFIPSPSLEKNKDPVNDLGWEIKQARRKTQERKRDA